jgi:hypothetical protein
MASAHQYMTEWTPQRFIDWGQSIDQSVGLFITNLLEIKQHPEQAYKSCLGILSSAKKVGNERVINACKRAMEHNIYNYKFIQNMLIKGTDLLSKDDDNENHTLPEHKNIRGENYYK